MAISIIQKKIDGGNSITSLDVTFTSACTVNSTFWVAIGTKQEGLNPACSDNASNSYTTINQASSNQTEAWNARCVNGSSSAVTVTGTADATPSDLAVAIHEIGDIDTSSPEDVKDTNSSTGASSLNCNDAPVTTTNADDILLGAIAKNRDEHGSQTVPTDWTQFHLFDASTLFELWTAYRIVSSTSAYDATFSLGESIQVAGTFVALKQAAAGGATNPKGPLGMPFHGPFGGPVSV